MATIGYANLPIPAGGDSPTTPGHLAELAQAIDPLLWQPVTNQADRDARLSGAPAGTVAKATDATTWIKMATDTNTWVTFWEPLKAWQALTLASGYEAGQTDPEYRIEGSKVHLRGTIQRTDGAVLPVSGVKIASVPSTAYPAQIARLSGTASLTGDAMTATGRVEVFSHDQDSNSLGGAGSVIWYSQDGSQVTGGTPGVFWADISGYYWLD